MSKAADRLAEDLERVEQELADLKEKIENDKNEELWRWARHVELPKEQTLPVPRMEMFLDEENSDEWNRVWIYRMVHRHFLGHCVGIPLGCTKQGGSFSKVDILNMLPFRDGAHMKHDARTFGWPAYMIVGKEVREIDTSERTQ